MCVCVCVCVERVKCACVREGLERSVWFGTERDRTALPFRMLQEHKLNAPHHSFISLVMSLVVQILEYMLGSNIVFLLEFHRKDPL